MQTDGWLRRGAGPGARVAYRIAGLDFTASTPIPALGAFRCECRAVEAAAPVPFRAGRERRTTGLLGGRERPVSARYESGGCRLTVDGQPLFELTPDTLHWRRTGTAGTVADAFLEEALLGPALLLFLALRGRFALHASAARPAGGGAWLFLGDSGAGKSTLAASALSVPGWEPVADDIVIVSGVEGGSEPSEVRLWPAFPQLKLAPDDQYAGDFAPETLPLAGCCIIEPRPAAGAPGLLRATPRDAGLALLRQGVSARLMDDGLLEAQLALLAAPALIEATRRLAVPRRLDALPGVLRVLEYASSNMPGR